MLDPQALRQQKILRLDQVVVVIARKPRAKAVGGLRRFAGADRVGSSRIDSDSGNRVDFDSDSGVRVSFDSDSESANRSTRQRLLRQQLLRVGELSGGLGV